MAEVKTIHGGRIPDQPDQEIISDLERLLELAKSGKMIGIGYAACYQDGTQATGWSGAAGSRHPLGTAIMMLFHRYSSRLFDAKQRD